MSGTPEKLSVQERIARLKQNKDEIYNSSKRPTPLNKAQSQSNPVTPSSASGSGKSVGSAGIAKKLASYRSSSASGITLDSNSSAFVKPSPKNGRLGASPSNNVSNNSIKLGTPSATSASRDDVEQGEQKDSIPLSTVTEDEDAEDEPPTRLSIADRIKSFNTAAKKTPPPSTKPALSSSSAEGSSVRSRVAALKAKSADKNDSSKTKENTPNTAEPGLRKGDSKSQSGSKLSTMSAESSESRPVSVIRHDDDSNTDAAASYTAAVLAVKTEEEKNESEEANMSHSSLSRPAAPTRHPPHPHHVNADELVNEDGVSIKEIIAAESSNETKEHDDDIALETQQLEQVSAAEAIEVEVDDEHAQSATIEEQGLSTWLKEQAKIDKIVAEEMSARLMNEFGVDRLESLHRCCQHDRTFLSEKLLLKEDDVEKIHNALLSNSKDDNEPHENFPLRVRSVDSSESDTSKISQKNFGTFRESSKIISRGTDDKEICLPRLTATEEKQYFHDIFKSKSGSGGKSPRAHHAFPSAKHCKIEAHMMFPHEPDFKSHMLVVQELHHHSSVIHCMQFSPCGNYLATAGKDRDIMVWCIGALPPSLYSSSSAVQQDVADPSGDKASMPSFKNRAISKDDVRFPVVEDSGYVNILHPEPYRILTGHEADVTALAWNNESFLVSGSVDFFARVWNVVNENCVTKLEHDDVVSTIASHPSNDEIFVTGCFDQKIRVWNIHGTEGNCIQCIDTKEKITALCFRPDGGAVCVGMDKGIIAIYEYKNLSDPASFHLSSEIKGSSKEQRSRVTSVTYTSVSLDEKTLKEPSMTLKTSGDISKQQQVIPPFDALLIASDDSRIRLVDLRSGSLLRKYHALMNSRMMIRSQLSTDCRYIISGTENGSAFIWRTGDDEGVVMESVGTIFSCCRSNAAIASFEQYEAIHCGEFPVPIAIFAPPSALERYIRVVSVSGTKISHSSTSFPTVAAPEDEGAAPPAESSTANEAQSTEELSFDDWRQRNYSSRIVISADTSGTMKVYVRLSN